MKKRGIASVGQCSKGVKKKKGFEDVERENGRRESVKYSHL